ncbi:MAG TPA: VOC family protein [Stellaceae bacterium]|nr:VOC family protein [Stellaceae bacterium]
MARRQQRSSGFIGIDAAIFGAPDLAVPRKLFSDFGLKKLKDSKSGLVFATEIGSEIVVRPTGAKTLPPKLNANSEFREVIWGVASARDVDRIAAELARDRAVRQDRDGTIHTVDDGGVNIGIRVWRHGKEPKRAASLPLNAPGARGRVDAPSPMYERARPFRIGHIVFAVPDVRAAERFYTNRLGFSLSDRYAGGAATFLRYAPRADHHNLFMMRLPSRITDLNHLAFEVHDIHEVFGGGLHFSKLGWKTAVGPGRHPISSAYFWYFTNPLGGMLEYFSNPDFVTEAWKPTNFRLNRFSEWHLIDGLPAARDTTVRPSLKAAKSMGEP